MKSFVEKYQPQSLEEIPQSVGVLKSLIEKKGHVLLYGPTGSGKTTAVYLLAKLGDYEVVEFNASDLRNKAQVESVIQSAVMQQSLFQQKRIVLIDEVDGLSGTEDRGGGTALARVLDNAHHPMVLIANDPYEDKLKEVRKKATLLEFSSVKTGDIVRILQKVCLAEEIQEDEQFLKKIAVNANGDVRAALNDLQANTIQKKGMIEGITPREYETDIMHALSNILKTRSMDCARVLEHVNVDLDELVLWLDENLPSEYQKVEDLANAYEKVAKADIFQGRIRRWQYWRLLVYRSLLLSAGVSLAKEQPYKTFVKYKRTMRLLKIWQANIRNAKKKMIAEKIAKYTHHARREVFKNFNKYRLFITNPKIMQELKLDAEEAEYLHNV